MRRFGNIGKFIQTRSTIWQPMQPPLSCAPKYCNTKYIQRLNFREVYFGGKYPRIMNCKVFCNTYLPAGLLISCPTCINAKIQLRRRLPRITFIFCRQFALGPTVLPTFPCLIIWTIQPYLLTIYIYSSTTE